MHQVEVARSAGLDLLTVLYLCVSAYGVARHSGTDGTSTNAYTAGTSLPSMRPRPCTQELCIRCVCVNITGPRTQLVKHFCFFKGDMGDYSTA